MCLASFPNNSDKEKSKWKGLELRKDPAQDRSTKLHSALDEYFISMLFSLLIMSIIFWVLDYILSWSSPEDLNQYLAQYFTI